MRYKKQNLVANGKMGETSTMVFRGRDKKDRMILVMLQTLSAKQGEGKTIEEARNEVSLVLSYIENPDEPDIRAITIKDDEF